MIGHPRPLAINSGPRLAVRFTAQWQNYFRGDVASFPARMARGLVDRGKAEPVNIAAADAKPPEGAEWTVRPPGEPPLRRPREEADPDEL
jgi:hypothetical protein